MFCNTACSLMLHFLHYPAFTTKSAPQLNFLQCNFPWISKVIPVGCDSVLSWVIGPEKIGPLSSKNQIQNQTNRDRITCVFPASSNLLALLRILICSLWYFPWFWLTAVISLVLVLWHNLKWPLTINSICQKSSGFFRGAMKSTVHENYFMANGN